MSDERNKKTYVCAACNEEFQSSWSDEEAAAETLALFPESVANKEPMVVICDDCFERGVGKRTGAN